MKELIELDAEALAARDAVEYELLALVEVDAALVTAKVFSSVALIIEEVDVEVAMVVVLVDG